VGHANENGNHMNSIDPLPRSVARAFVMIRS
jgi:hypothetical protein